MTTVNRKNTRTSPLRRLGRIAIGLVVLVGLALLAGSIYQQSAMAADRATYVSGDNLVTVNGVEMHIRCTGEGQPTVIFESGAGTPYLNWWQIQETIAQEVRTCVYDRAGIGWSTYTGDTPTPEHVANTLHRLLENAGESAPYVLVGHSLGGVYVREFAAQYRDEVVGMVLIDSSHEQQQARLPEALSALAGAEQPIIAICRVLAPTGLLRLLNMGAANAQFAENTALYDEEIAIFNQSQFCAGTSLDQAAITGLDTAIAPASLGDMPLAVLTAGIKQADHPENMPPDIALETLQQADAVWLELQEELAALSSNSSWTVVEDASHYIHLDDPQAVINAIRNILAQVTDS